MEPEKQQTPAFTNCVFYGNGRDAFQFPPVQSLDEPRAIYLNCVFYSQPAPWWIRLWKWIKR
jgi:hypothetical protein